jgi:flagellar biosynthesis/type III secretory pathway protein FliH
MLKKFEFQEFSLLTDVNGESMEQALGHDMLQELAAAMQNPDDLELGEETEEDTPPYIENFYTEAERITYGEERYQQGYIDAKGHFEAIGHEEHQRTMEALATHMALLRDELFTRRTAIAPQLVEIIGSIMENLCQQLPDDAKLAQLQSLLEQGLAANDEDTAFTLLVKTQEDATIYEALVQSLALPFSCIVQVNETLSGGELRLQWHDGYVGTDQQQWIEAMKALLAQVKLI